MLIAIRPSRDQLGYSGASIRGRFEPELLVAQVGGRLPAHDFGRVPRLEVCVRGIEERREAADPAVPFLARPMVLDDPVPFARNCGECLGGVARHLVEARELNRVDVIDERAELRELGRSRCVEQ